MKCYKCERRVFCRFWFRVLDMGALLKDAVVDDSKPAFGNWLEDFANHCRFFKENELMNLQSSASRANMEEK